jgi:hypothetical protein
VTPLQTTQLATLARRKLSPATNERRCGRLTEERRGILKEGEPAVAGLRGTTPPPLRRRS